MIKVWGRTNSINVQKVLWTLGELNLRYERIDAGMAHGVVETPAYRAMNPHSLVPTVEDGGLVLWESNVIIRYLAEKYGMGSLCPENREERFSAERWMDWQQTTLYPPIRPIFTNLIRTPPEKRDSNIVEANRDAAEQAIAILEAQLSSREFVGGTRFTMGDIPVGAT